MVVSGLHFWADLGERTRRQTTPSPSRESARGGWSTLVIVKPKLSSTPLTTSHRPTDADAEDELDDADLIAAAEEALKEEDKFTSSA